jgi:hypothetical protein
VFLLRIVFAAIHPAASTPISTDRTPSTGPSDTAPSKSHTYPARGQYRHLTMSAVSSTGSGADNRLGPGRSGKQAAAPPDDENEVKQAFYKKLC